MRRTSLAFALLGTVSFGAAAYGIEAAFDTQPTLMSRADHDREWREIERHTRAALGLCRDRPERLRETCRLRARAECLAAARTEQAKILASARLAAT